MGPGMAWANYPWQQTHAVSQQTMPERDQLRSWVANAVQVTVLATQWGANNVDWRVREQLGPVGPLPHMGCQDPDFGLLCQDPTLLQQEGLASAMFIASLLRKGGRGKSNASPRTAAAREQQKACSAGADCGEFR